MKREVYEKIVKAAGIVAGDMVLVQYWMGETFSEDVAFLQAEIAKAGATPMMVVQNINVSQLINEIASSPVSAELNPLEASGCDSKRPPFLA